MEVVMGRVILSDLSSLKTPLFTAFSRHFHKSIFYRFFGDSKNDPECGSISQIDYDREIAMVAINEDAY